MCVCVCFGVCGPQALLTQGRIERLFQSQRRWEVEEMGALCMAGRDQEEKMALFGREQFLLQYFLGFLIVGRLTGEEQIVISSV